MLRPHRPPQRAASLNWDRRWPPHRRHRRPRTRFRTPRQDSNPRRPTGHHRPSTNDHVVIVDAKTGHEQPQPRRPGHDLPVRRAPGPSNAVPERQDSGGEVTYRDPHGPHFEQMRCPTTSSSRTWARIIRRLTAETNLPRRVPSHQECRFCDISAADCPERMDDGYEPAQRRKPKISRQGGRRAGGPPTR